MHIIYMYTLCVHVCIYVYIGSKQGGLVSSDPCLWVEELCAHSSSAGPEPSYFPAGNLEDCEMQTQGKCLPRFNQSSLVCQTISFPHQLTTFLPNNCENTYPEWIQ